MNDPMETARMIGDLADRVFAKACDNAHLRVEDTRIGSPLLNLHVAWAKQRKRPAFEKRAA